jgi:hypothetical protein
LLFDTGQAVEHFGLLVCNGVAFGECKHTFGHDGAELVGNFVVGQRSVFQRVVQNGTVYGEVGVEIFFNCTFSSACLCKGA